MRRYLIAALLLVSATAFSTLRLRADPPVEGTHETVVTPKINAKATFKDESARLTVKEGESAVDIDLSTLLPFKGIYQCDILHEAVVGKERYLVLDVQASSRPGNPNGACGAGEESVIVWVHINEHWAVEESQMILYASCWNDSEGKVEKKGEQLEVHWAGMAAVSAKKTAVFVFAKPELGFVRSK